jgi:hypothetical protein
MSQVNIGACQCPGTPHPDGDVVELRDKMGYTGGSVLQAEMAEYLSTPIRERGPWTRLNARLKGLYLEEGIEGWNLLDAEGKPIPVSTLTIREQFLDDFTQADRATAIADAADDLYYEAVLAPLVNRLLESSPSTPTNGSTSQTPSTETAPTESPSTPGSPKRRKPSKRSSTTTSQMGATVTISSPPVGAYSSSQS